MREKGSSNILSMSKPYFRSRFQHLLILLSLLLYGNQVISDDEFIYDLRVDFIESTNLKNNTSYASLLNTLRQQAWYWNNSTLYLPSTDTTLKKSTWTASNGVVPWLTSDFMPYEIEQIYAYEDAPHIIFCFVDDWGYNDIGYRSTYMNFTTPNIDRLASEGIKLENYFTHETCIPSRGALLTGRYSNRLGLWKQRGGAELPLNETTLAHEMKSAGYATYMVSEARR
jgi:hypothetical protein